MIIDEGTLLDFYTLLLRYLLHLFGTILELNFRCSHINVKLVSIVILEAVIQPKQQQHKKLFPVPLVVV